MEWLETTKNWLKNLLHHVTHHVVAYILIGLLTYLVGQHNGYSDGLRKGEEKAYADAKQAAIEQIDDLAQTAAKRAGAEVTEEFIKREVERTYAQELKDKERAGFEQCVSAGHTSDALERFYILFKEKIKRAAAAKTSHDRFEFATLILESKRQGEKSLNDIAHNVLDGFVDELESAIKGKDEKRIVEIIQRLDGTLKERDINFARAKQQLQLVK
jgi:hypothetical protein